MVEWTTVSLVVLESTSSSSSVPSSSVHKFLLPLNRKAVLVTPNTTATHTFAESLELLPLKSQNVRIATFDL